MPTITVKNIPPNFYESLKKAAALNHRSINSKIIASIEHTVRSQAVNPDQLLARARSLREKTAAYLLSDDELNRA